MTENLYVEFDEIIDSQKQMAISMGEKYNELLENVKKHTCETKYGTQSWDLGPFCPSLVADKIVGGFKKGRLYKDIPKTKCGDYVVYDIDSSGKLLRMQTINTFGNVVETYIIREENTEFSFIFIGQKVSIHYCPSTRTIYDNGKLVRFDSISLSHDAGMWSEIYTYNPDSPQKVECKQYYYVPRLTGSSKSVPVGMKGSPARLWMLDIELDGQGKVVKIEDREWIEGQKVLVYTYEKKRKTEIRRR